MSAVVEVSNDKASWIQYERTKTRIEDYQWVRAIEYVERSWSRAQIEGWLNTQSRNRDIRIEYSMDGGFSYQPFRLGHADDSARVFTIVQNHKYMVRGMALTENTSYVPPVDNSKAQAFLNAGYSPTGEKRPRSQTIKRWITFDENGYHILKSVPYDPGLIVSMVEQHIPFTLKEPNVNTFTAGPASLTHATPEKVIRGHVYEVSPCHSLTFNWRSVMTAHRRASANADDWAWVESARTYDQETYNMTSPCTALAVLSDKFYVDNSGKQFDKIGCKFLIPRHMADTFIRRVNSEGGYAVWIDHIVEQEQRQIAGGLENIMAVKEELKEAIASRNADILARKLFEVIEFRDRCIDELKDLNIVLGDARKTAIELIEESDAGASRSN